MHGVEVKNYLVNMIVFTSVSIFLFCAGRKGEIRYQGQVRNNSSSKEAHELHVEFHPVELTSSPCTAESK
jgi:hypothetical protein